MNTIARTKITTERAGLGGVGRFDQNNLQARHLRLVGDELPQLIEGPGVEDPSVFFSMFCVSPDIGEVLQCDGRVKSTSEVHDSLRYYMIYIAHKPLLPAGHLPQVPSGRMSSFRLQRASQPIVSIASVLDLLASKFRFIAAYSDIPDAEVNPQNILGVFHRFIRNLYCDIEIEFVSFFQQLTVAELDSLGEHLPLAFAEGEPDFLPAEGSGDRYDFTFLQADGTGKVKRQNSLFEDMFFFSVRFIRKCDLILKRTAQLGIELKSFFNSVVGKMMQCDPIETSLFPGYLGYVIKHIESLGQGFVQYLGLFLGRAELAFDSDFHIKGILPYRRLDVKANLKEVIGNFSAS
jgi:hypothetical protein